MCLCDFETKSLLCCTLDVCNGLRFGNYRTPYPALIVGLIPHFHRVNYISFVLLCNMPRQMKVNFTGTVIISILVDTPPQAVCFIWIVPPNCPMITRMMCGLQLFFPFTPVLILKDYQHMIEISFLYGGALILLLLLLTTTTTTAIVYIIK